MRIQIFYQGHHIQKEQMQKSTAHTKRTEMLLSHTVTSTMPYLFLLFIKQIKRFLMSIHITELFYFDVIKHVHTTHTTIHSLKPKDHLCITSAIVCTVKMHFNIEMKIIPHPLHCTTLVLLTYALMSNYGLSKMLSPQRV